MVMMFNLIINLKFILFIIIIEKMLDLKNLFLNLDLFWVFVLIFLCCLIYSVFKKDKKRNKKDKKN